MDLRFHSSNKETKTFTKALGKIRCPLDDLDLG
jgi:hypothetical protein